MEILSVLTEREYGTLEQISVVLANSVHVRNEKKMQYYPLKRKREQGIFENNKMLVTVIGNNICLCYFFLMSIWLK